MKAILDLSALIVFFVLYKTTNIETATAGLMVASVIQISLLKLIYKTVSKQELIVCVMILVFGALTLLFHSPEFLKWKVTIIQFLFAGVLLVGHIMKKDIIKNLLKEAIEVDNQKVWNNVTYGWIAFFVASGVLNIYIASFLSLDAWVNYKVFGLFAASLVATAISVFYLFAHAKKVVDK